MTKFRSRLAGGAVLVLGCWPAPTSLHMPAPIAKLTLKLPFVRQFSPGDRVPESVVWKKFCFFAKPALQVDQTLVFRASEGDTDFICYMRNPRADLDWITSLTIWNGDGTATNYATKPLADI